MENLLDEENIENRRDKTNTDKRSYTYNTVLYGSKSEVVFGVFEQFPLPHKK